MKRITLVTKRITLTVCSLLVLSASASAQGQYVKPTRPPTPAQQAAVDAIGILRDSVTAAGSAIAFLNRDLASRPAPALEQQAALIADRCAAAERQRDTSLALLKAQEFPDTIAQKGQRRMLASMSQLKAPLKQCIDTYRPLASAGKGEEVRGYGVTRGKPIVKGLNAFEHSVLNASKDMGLPVRQVIRAGPSPLDLPPPEAVRPAPASP